MRKILVDPLRRGVKLFVRHAFFGVRTLYLQNCRPYLTAARLGRCLVRVIASSMELQLKRSTDLKHYCGSKSATSKLPRKFAGVLKKPKRRVTCVADGTDLERPRRRDTFPFPARRSSVDWLLNRTSRLCSAAQFDDAAPKSVVRC